MSNFGRPKMATSIRARGSTFIRIDKPLRADLKCQAAARDLTLVDYLRYLADMMSKTPVQAKGWPGNPGAELSQKENALMRTVENLSTFLAVKFADSIQFVGETEDELDRHMQLLSWAVSPEYAESRLAGAKELLRIKQEQIAQAGQARLNLQIGEAHA